MNVSFSDAAWEEYVGWAQGDKQVVRKINELIKDIQRNSYAGLGKPEPLKHELSGYWSRRITSEHRLVYKIEDGTIKIVQVRYHY